jgi:hypothetical protein
MSSQPCDLCGQPARGKLTSLYVTVVLDRDRHKKRLKVCPSDLVSVQATYGDQWSDGFIKLNGKASRACCGCGTVLEETGWLHPLYVTAYDQQSRRYDYSAEYCEPCARTVIGHFSLSTGAQNA